MVPASSTETFTNHLVHGAKDGACGGGTNKVRGESGRLLGATAAATATPTAATSSSSHNKPFIIMPDSQFHLTWIQVRVVVALYIVWVTPVRVVRLVVHLRVCRRFSLARTPHTANTARRPPPPLNQQKTTTSDNKHQTPPNRGSPSRPRAPGSGSRPPSTSSSRPTSRSTFSRPTRTPRRASSCAAAARSRAATCAGGSPSTCSPPSPWSWPCARPSARGCAPCAPTACGGWRPSRRSRRPRGACGDCACFAWPGSSSACATCARRTCWGRWR